MFKVSKIVFFLALVVIISSLLSIGVVQSQNKPKAADSKKEVKAPEVKNGTAKAPEVKNGTAIAKKPDAKPAQKPVKGAETKKNETKSNNKLTTKKAINLSKVNATTKSNRTRKPYSSRFYTNSRYKTACYSCNTHLLNLNTSFISNLKHFRDSCSKVTKNTPKEFCKYSGSCYTAKFGLYYVRGCMSQRSCEDYQKTKNFSSLNYNLKNLRNFQPDSFSCCKGNYCNGKNTASIANHTTSAFTAILFNIFILFVTNLIKKHL